MITFHETVDYRVRQSSPQVAKINRNGDIAYIIIGTPYGCHHKTNGDIREWKSFSGASKALRRYSKIWS
jgi:hypothetical protein